MTKHKYKLFSIITFLFSLVFTFSLGEVFYNSIDGTDFYRYFRYIEYFDGSIEKTSREQGLFYFWFVSIFIDSYDPFYLADKWEYIYSSAIQLANFILYLIGLLGLFIFMKYKNIETTKAFFALTFLNFFPPIFGGRLIMKPEILAFALFPWIVLGVDNYLKNKKILSLILTAPLLAIVATSKGTIFVITITAILFIYFKQLKLSNLFDIGISSVIFFFMSYFLYQENLSVNNISILSHPELESYLFKAPLSFIYSISLNDLFFNPFRNIHSGSLVGITLIDLFGDYFNRYWDHERSLFLANRREIITFLDHPRRNLSVLFSLLFLLSTFMNKKSYRFSAYRKVYLIGILILLFTSLGLFGLHFNPNKGDTVKTHYYFFLLAFSFVFIVINLLNKTQIKTQIFLLLITFISFTFIVGFPKNYEKEFNITLSEKVSTTITCHYASFYFETLTNSDIECLTKEIATCGLYDDFNKPIEHEEGYLIFQSDNFFQSINLQDNDGNLITGSGYAECLHYFNGGYEKPKTLNDESRIPTVNRLFLLLSIISIFVLTMLNRQYLLKR